MSPLIKLTKSGNGEPVWIKFTNILAVEPLKDRIETCGSKVHINHAIFTVNERSGEIITLLEEMYAKL